MIEAAWQFLFNAWDHTYGKVGVGFLVGLMIGMALERLGHMKKEDK